MWFSLLTKYSSNLSLSINVPAFSSSKCKLLATYPHSITFNFLKIFSTSSSVTLDSPCFFLKKESAETLVWDLPLFINSPNKSNQIWRTGFSCHELSRLILRREVRHCSNKNPLRRSLRSRPMSLPKLYIFSTSLFCI